MLSQISTETRLTICQYAVFVFNKATQTNRAWPSPCVQTQEIWANAHEMHKSL